MSTKPLVTEEEFFAAYNKQAKKIVGVPGAEMNRPVTPANNFKGAIGIEIEVEGRGLPASGHVKAVGKETGAMWVGHEDHSLRGESLEYVLSAPCTPGEVIPLMDGLFETFERAGTRLNNSNRCSTHIHLNMNGARVNHVTSFMLMWALFERGLIRWNGEERVSNHFCLGLHDAVDTVQAWDSFLRTGGRNWQRNLKYSAFNILPLNDRGSIEIRCGAAADDKDRPARWALFLHALQQFSMTKYPNPQVIAADLSERGAASMLEAVCGKDHRLMYEELIAQANGANNFNEECLLGFRNVQHLALGFPWDTWKEVIERAYVPNPFGENKPKMGLRRGARIEPVMAPEPPPVAAWDDGFLDAQPRRDDQVIAEEIRQQAERIRGNQRAFDRWVIDNGQVRHVNQVNNLGGN